jgi:ribosomal protein S18 acetylase RimI-like enzyme
MNGIKIRTGRPADAAGIASLDVETWRTTYAGVLSVPYLVGLSPARREIGWRHVLSKEPGDVRVAVDPTGAVIGFGSCGPCRGDSHFQGEVFTLYVGPDWQNQGIGRRLLIALFSRLVSAGRSSAIIWVLRDNPARFFYQRLGGRQVSCRGLVVGGTTVAADAYGWPDLPGYLAALASRTSEPEP